MSLNHLTLTNTQLLDVKVNDLYILGKLYYGTDPAPISYQVTDVAPTFTLTPTPVGGNTIDTKPLVWTRTGDLVTVSGAFNWLNTWDAVYKRITVSFPLNPDSRFNPAEGSQRARVFVSGKSMIPPLDGESDKPLILRDVFPVEGPPVPGALHYFQYAQSDGVDFQLGDTVGYVYFEYTYLAAPIVTEQVEEVEAEDEVKEDEVEDIPVVSDLV